MKRAALIALAAGVIVWIVFLCLAPSKNVSTPAESESAVARADDLNQAWIEITKLISSEEEGVSPFVSARILENGSRLEITVTDTWYTLQPFMKERVIETLSKAYAAIACQNGLRKKCDATDYPETSIIDTFGKEVANASTFGNTKVLR